MRQPKVLLIYPPNQLMDVETPRPDGSLGLLYLAGALRELGIEPDILDASVGTDEDNLQDTFYRRVWQPNKLTRIGMSWDRIREVIAAQRYDIVGIDCKFTPQTNMALRVARISKEVDPEILVIAGGVNARNLVSRFLKDGWVDLICLTEGEKVIQEVAQRFTAGKEFDGIAGTVFKKGNQVKTTPVRPDTIITNLDELPFPAWDKLPFEKYVRIASPHGVDMLDRNLTYAPMMTSRGCPFQCSYCHISMERKVRGALSEDIVAERLKSVELSGEIGELRLKSDRRVLKEIDVLISLGVKKIFIEDDSLLAKKGRVERIFRSILDKGLTIADANGVNIIHLFQRATNGRLEPNKEYLELLYNAGLRQILLPVESGSQRILDKYATGKLLLYDDKDPARTPIMDLEKLFHIATREVGIICPTNIMIGFPDETEEEMQMSIDLAKRLIDAGAAFATFFIPIPFPGSALYNMAIAGGYLSSNFNPDDMNWKHHIMKNTTVPGERIEEICKQAWHSVNPPEHIARKLREAVGSHRLAGDKP